ncbi:LysR family transcriptional regulator [Lacticaseibacillus yichunensis]|uniref:LysR family transcriptional regulator n=1 Tax=Lacticaseibacillus yichunensis TaxID=2486015 RepID=A0ABW4CTA4_9LACO|nr:LysR family transcriptional regulator [Lacticaseibacillus yichunensis]
MFERLRVFDAVYQTRSFTAAAQRLFVSQPTVSHHIAQLEEELHTPLFDRSGKQRVIPLPAADALAEFAQGTLTSWAQLQDRLAHLTGGKGAYLRLGVSQSIATLLLPRVIAALQQELPQLQYDLTVSNSQAVLAGLGEKHLDLGLLEQPLNRSGMTRQLLAADQLVLAGAATGRLLTRENGSGINFYTDQYLHETDRQPTSICRVNNNAALVEMVAAGVGQAVMSAALVPDGVPTTPLGPHFLRSFYLMRPSDSQDPWLRRASDLIARVAADGEDED